MPNSWFVDPDVIRLPIYEEDGDPNEDPSIPWIEIKKQLSYEDSQRLRASSIRSMHRTGDDEDQVFDLDMSAYRFTRMLVYLVDWNATDHNGKIVELSKSTIFNLRQDIGDAIDACLDRYLEEQESSGNSRGPVSKLGPGVEIETEYAPK